VPSQTLPIVLATALFLVEKKDYFFHINVAISSFMSISLFFVFE